jgi:TonB family protein
MIGFVPHSKRRRSRMFSRIDGAIHLNVPSENRFRKTNLMLAVFFIFIVVFVLHFASKALQSAAIEQDQVQIIRMIPPAAAVQQVKLAPKPDRIRQNPEQPTLSLRPKDAPPPVFGLPGAATNQKGDMAVATGNTLMKKADPVIQKAAPIQPDKQPEVVKLDKQPAALNQVIPEYPSWAEEQGVTATVQLLVTINAQGQVQSVSVVKSGGNDFTRNAVKAVKATRFQPCIKNGVALPSQFLFTYNFIF